MARPAPAGLRLSSHSHLCLCLRAHPHTALDAQPASLTPPLPSHRHGPRCACSLPVPAPPPLRPHSVHAVSLCLAPPPVHTAHAAYLCLPPPPCPRCACNLPVPVHIIQRGIHLYQAPGAAGAGACQLSEGGQGRQAVGAAASVKAHVGQVDGHSQGEAAGARGQRGRGVQFSK